MDLHPIRRGGGGGGGRGEVGMSLNRTFVAEENRLG